MTLRNKSSFINGKTGGNDTGGNDIYDDGEKNGGNDIWIYNYS